MTELPMTDGETRCAALTPTGRGAIAAIGVRGPEAIAVVAKCFRAASGRELREIPLGRAVFGRFRTLCGSEEELVIGLASPGSVEVHCHGGTAAVQAVIEALVAAGCREETWRDHLAEEIPDPIAAAALVALAEARTERTAGILLDQYHGALRRELGQIRDLIGVDAAQASARLQSLGSRSDLGRHLTRPWRVVLTGAPNVGKSSLINAFLGYQRAIVFDQPGTTRDVLTATTALDGWPVELADTAGLRVGGDAIEAEGVSRALRQIAEADLVVEVTEAAGDRGEATGDRSRPTPHKSGRPHLVIQNKCDLWPPTAAAAGLTVSAKTGLGIDRLCSAIVRQLLPISPPNGAAVPFTERQMSALEQVRQLVDQGKLEEAQQAIAALCFLTPDP